MYQPTSTYCSSLALYNEFFLHFRAALTMGEKVGVTFSGIWGVVPWGNDSWLQRWGKFAGIIWSCMSQSSFCSILRPFQKRFPLLCARPCAMVVRNTSNLIVAGGRDTWSFLLMRMDPRSCLPSKLEMLEAVHSIPLYTFLHTLFANSSARYFRTFAHFSRLCSSIFSFLWKHSLVIPLCRAPGFQLVIITKASFC